MAMTDKEYLGTGGNQCPFCSSSNIEAVGSMEADGGVATQSVVCHECDEEWEDCYQLTGYNHG